MKSLNTSSINLEQIKEALERMLKTSIEYHMTNEKIQSVIYQYLVHLEAQNIIRDFLDPKVEDIPNAKNLRVELATKKWYLINVCSDPPAPINLTSLFPNPIIKPLSNTP